MNTKYTLTSSAILFAILGAAFTFISAEIMQIMGTPINALTEILLQILGSLYLALAILNWNNKDKVIGGIYNRPLALANCLHAVLVGMALIRFVMADPSSKILLIFAGFYITYAVIFYLILFRHPKNLN